jgi:hypothetical protein
MRSREKSLRKKGKMSKLIMKYRHKLIICTREREWSSINTARQRENEKRKRGKIINVHKEPKFLAAMKWGRKV